MRRIKNRGKRIVPGVLFMGVIVITGVSLLVSQPETTVATQGEFAVKLVEALGFKSLLPEDASVEECVVLLENFGITPPGGFEADKEVERRDIAVLMLKAKNLEGELLDQVKPSKKEGFVEVEKAHVMEFEGEVAFRKGSQQEWKPVWQAMELFQGDSVKTSEDSFVDLRIGTFGGIRIQESTEIALRELTESPDQKKGDVVIFISRGEVLSKTDSLSEGSSYMTLSPTTAAAVRGTIPGHKVTPDGDVITSAGGTVIAWLVDALGLPVGEEIVIGEGKTTTSSARGFSPLQDADSELLTRMRYVARGLMDEMGNLERHWTWLNLQNWTQDNVNAAEQLLENKGIDISSTNLALQSLSPKDGEKKVDGTDPWAKTPKDDSGGDSDADLPDVAGQRVKGDEDRLKKLPSDATRQTGTPPFVNESDGITSRGSDKKGKHSTHGGSDSSDRGGGVNIP